MEWKDTNSISIGVQGIQEELDGINPRVHTVIGSTMFEFDETTLYQYESILQKENQSITEMVKDGIILRITEEQIQEKSYPLDIIQRIKIQVIQGDTNKILYEGEMKNDFKQDTMLLGAEYKIKRGIGEFLEERRWNENARRIGKLFPISGVENPNE